MLRKLRLQPVRQPSELHDDLCRFELVPVVRSMNIADGNFQFDRRLTLPDDEVHLWRVDLEALRGQGSSWEKLLSSDEEARAARFRSPLDQHRYATTRGLLRRILAGYLDVAPSTLKFSYSEKEKPSLAEANSDAIAFNVSHSGGVSLLAFTRGREIGVDVEQIRRDFDLEAIARRFFSEHERREMFALAPEERFKAFYRCWTRKESYIKATGDGLSLPLHQFDVSIVPGERDALIATRPDSTEAAKWSMREVSAGQGYAAALCVKGRNWKLKGWEECKENH
jgi:4'-phosphopantetheinyl transferase